MKHLLIADDDLLNNIFHQNKNKKRELPQLTCESCGNCELKYDENLIKNEHIGFCLRFKETVKLQEKNVSCWTAVDSDYFRRTAKMRDKEVNKKHYVNLKKAESLKLNLNQTQLF